MTAKMLIAALVAGGLAAPAAALAPPAQRTVSYADLDLTRGGDVARLRRRIAGAIEEVCGGYAAAESWAEPEISRCRAEARNRAEGQLAAILERRVRLASAGSGSDPAR